MGVRRLVRWSLVGWAAGAAAVAQAQVAGGSVVYRCPGNVYTDAITAQEAKDKGCRTLEGAPVTVVQGVRPRAAAPSVATSGPRPADSKVEPGEQRARDSDARRILDSELRMEMERLAILQKEFNNGEPERRGDERNYQKYQDRVAEMKATIARKESDIAALRRELGKLPQ
ncbi:MAG: hypothetical protein AD742_16475 [Methylibium sp. NZG]|nr:MAG: hypothetical protein AD742_16475 [Methylibium sp. NZG]